MKFYTEPIAKSPRIPKLVEALFEKMPQIEADRAVLLTESYKATEGECDNRPYAIAYDLPAYGCAVFEFDYVTDEPKKTARKKAVKKAAAETGEKAVEAGEKVVEEVKKTTRKRATKKKATEE